MQALILTLAAFIVTGAALRRHSPTGSRPTPAQRTDLDGIEPHVKRAAALLDQLHELNDLITSAEVCAPREKAQALRLEWVNHNGSTHSTSIWMDGTDSTDRIRAAAERERDTVRAALLDEIRAAYLPAFCDAGTLTGTTTTTTGEG